MLSKRVNVCVIEKRCMGELLVDVCRCRVCMDSKKSYYYYRKI